MIDVVLGYHMNPLTCGVAKFNHQLAERLGVPYSSFQAQPMGYPLVSVKPLEMGHAPFIAAPEYDLLVHGEVPREWGTFFRNASHIWNAEDLGCPSTIRGNATRGSLNILSFGMAHKYQQAHWDRLKHLLDCTPATYTLSLSTAIHENTPWDVTFTENIRLMRDIFGDHLRVLGFLADDALARELRSVQAVALFYDPGVRANNTTLWAAIEAGTPVITNLDEDSPPELQHHVSVFDIDQLTEWPDAARCREVRHGATEAAKAYSWETIISKLTAQVPA